MPEKSLSKENQISLKIAQSGSDFVGIKITQSERSVAFPMGYALKVSALDSSKIKKEERNEILNLIKSIALCTLNKKGERVSALNGEIKNDFPVKSMLFIIEDFLDRGIYYTEKETLHTKSTGGKINWSRTIKSVKPAVSESGITFLDFIVRKNRIQENQLITEIHKYCVHKCFEIFGFLYTSSFPEKGLLDEDDISKNRKYYAQVLQEKIGSTYLESNIELFENLLNFINSFDSENETKEAAYGTNCFQVVWESLVDSVFGNVQNKEKEEYFYPASRWNFPDEKPKKNAPLRPDTIMIVENPLAKNRRKCFIIDSKYYSYTMLRKLDFEEDESGQESVLVHGSIPGTDSIQKQITYAQYIDASMKSFDSEKREKYRFNPGDIFNVFILPEDNNIEEKLKYIGNAASDWHDGSKNYHTVHAVTLDTKFLLENGNKKCLELQKELAELIERNI
ncbi:LlaJI family restriction endonuclease [Treponema sp. UBA6852]|uniref:LlaJI family restriction endonuclease n=1 Tax=Treponema sp. UBA6852 TaxID=1947744 RepID=UPI0025DFB536|nr:LlaJI family restriction endonuclease [Treponema sp. UBA6852]